MGLRGYDRFTFDGEPHAEDSVKMENISILLPGIGPDERHWTFEESLFDLFEEIDAGTVTGSGTFGDQSGVVASDISIQIPELSYLDRIFSVLISAGAPEETQIKIVSQKRVLSLMQLRIEFCRDQSDS